MADANKLPGKLLGKRKKRTRATKTNLERIFSFGSARPTAQKHLLDEKNYIDRETFDRNRTAIAFSVYLRYINATLILDPSTVSEFLYPTKERTCDVLFKGTFYREIRARNLGVFSLGAR